MYYVITMMMAVIFANASHAAITDKPHVLYQNNHWQTFGFSKNSDGDPMCGMSAMIPDNTSGFFVKFVNDETAIQIWKMNWQLGEGTKVPLKVKFFASRSSDEFNAIASARPSKFGTMVTMKINPDDSAAVLKMFADAERITVSFPQGDEPNWHLNMIGSRQAVESFVQCGRLLKSVRPTQPVKPIQRKKIKGEEI